ncbi:hypothetical protein EOA85_11165 [Mesorhizobium sp. M5C.F.Ca.IN.020.29.1.1]|uniref:hypothetical protein n=1 Tax=unclassified Mesorhizobium TaxID=325217 RepID=UPI000FCABF99|nr:MULTISPECIES: hypothetical protein [unclassified Mesorhizobium]RUV59648.1 hypothetical protein EOA85_11165 [Mesorhizobium sp. M5C.F.Ca.IN.020.29.1.1]
MGNLFGGSKPKPPEPVRMPVPDDTASLAAADRQKRQIAQRTGRASTIMSRNTRSPSEAGTQAYTSTSLGVGTVQ